MQKQMALQLGKEDPLTTVWNKLREAKRQELVKRIAMLIARAAQEEPGLAEMEGNDEQNDH